MNFTGTSTQPRYNFGLNLSVAYKGFDFYMLWAGSAGFDLYWNHSSYNGTRTENGFGISQRVADNHYFYNPENPSDSRTNITAKYPRITDQTQRDNGTSSVFWKYKGELCQTKEHSDRIYNSREMDQKIHGRETTFLFFRRKSVNHNKLSGTRSRNGYFNNLSINQTVCIRCTTIFIHRLLI